MSKLFQFCKIVFNSSSNQTNWNIVRNFHLSVFLDKRKGNTPQKPMYRVIEKGHLVLENEYVNVDSSSIGIEISKQDEDLSQKVLNLVKMDALNKNTSRKFAIVHMFGRQFKVTNEDLVSITTMECDLDIGEEIVLEKVLMVGSENFSMFGRPILPKTDVRITATVVEKSSKFPLINYLFVAKRQTSVMRTQQENRVVFRINNIELKNVEL
uniref:Large ribosomal subunit protein bL21m n=1 Tax=Schmidtea mediterranea TaxID=79327 RepID=A0A2Z3D361_SCHMD|nr:mitochondrial large ribosomal subunit protein bL21m [Schmidtea mediterranea]